MVIHTFIFHFSSWLSKVPLLSYFTLSTSTHSKLFLTTSAVGIISLASLPYGQHGPTIQIFQPILNTPELHSSKLLPPYSFLTTTFFSSINISTPLPSTPMHHSFTFSYHSQTLEWVSSFLLHSTFIYLFCPPSSLSPPSSNVKFFMNLLIVTTEPVCNKEVASMLLHLFSIPEKRKNKISCLFLFP